MTCVWRRQPGSRHLRGTVFRCEPKHFILVLLWGILPGTVSALPNQVVVSAPDTPRAARERLADWAAQDRQWLRGLPPGQVALTLATADSSLVRIQRLVAGAIATAADSVPVARPLENLLRDRWLARGRLSTVVQLRGDTLVVTPGPAWILGNWDLTGDDFTGREHLLSTWLPRRGDVFRAADLDRGIDRVLAGTGEAGYPFARWVTRGVVLDPVTHEVNIRAVLLPGQQVWIGPITSDLAEPRATRFLARSSGLHPGNLFRNTELERAVDRLLARDLYTSVGVPRVYLTSALDTVGVHFPVVARRKANHLQVVLGLSRQEEGGSHLSGEVALRLPNLGGSGRKLQIGWRDDGVAKSRFGFSYLEPLAFGTELEMGVALESEVEQDSYTRFRLDNTWSLPVVSLWGLQMGVGWDRSTFSTGALELTSRMRASGALLHKRGDRTRSGWEGLFAIETAWRSATLRPSLTETGGEEPAETESVGALGEAVTQRIFRVDVGGELWLGQTLSLFGRSSFRQLTGGEDNVPLSEQFRFGGAATLRGYREDEFHGSQAAWGAVEMRIGRPESSRLYTFYDLGYFEFWTADPQAVDPAALLRRSDWPRGYGLGILARTPGGDFSLAIGFPGTVDFEQAKLHVTLMDTF